MTVFDIPGLEIFTTTGKNKFNMEWRNPAGTWFRQIIPTDTQLIHLHQEIQNQCIKINAHVPNYDYEANPLTGLITISDERVHLVPIYIREWSAYDYGR